MKKPLIKNHNFEHLNTVAEHFNHYMDSVGLRKEEVSNTQWMETERAFYAGFNMAINKLAMLSSLPENISIRAIDKLYDELNAFFTAKRSN